MSLIETESAVRKSLDEFHATETELARTKEKFEAAEATMATIAASTAIDDPDGPKMLQDCQYVVMAGPSRLKALEQRLADIKSRIDLASIEHGDELWRRFGDVKRGRIAKLTEGLRGHIADSAKLEKFVERHFIETDPAAELAQIEVSLNGISKFHVMDPLLRAKRVLAVTIPAE